MCGLIIAVVAALAIGSALAATLGPIGWVIAGVLIAAPVVVGVWRAFKAEPATSHTVTLIVPKDDDESAVNLADLPVPPQHETDRKAA